MDQESPPSESTGTLPVPVEIEEKVGEILGKAQGKSLSPQIVSEVTSEIVNFLQEESYSGPLPHPRHFAEFEQIHAGSANRILSMAEREQEHRHRMDETVLHANVHDMANESRYAFSGLICGLVFALALVVGGVICAYLGSEKIGLGFVAAGALGVVTSFINGRARKASEESKSGSSPPPAQAKSSDRASVRRKSGVSATRTTKRRPK